MKELRTQLRDADPLAREGGMSPQDVERMRRHVLSAEREPTPAGNGLFFALAATLVVASVGGVLLTEASLGESTVNPTAITAPSVSEQPVRQLHFLTPGGTRVIWTFNPNLEVR